jgi:hypothetical protein
LHQIHVIFSKKQRFRYIIPFAKDVSTSLAVTLEAIFRELDKDEKGTYLQMDWILYDK